jgi:hypothetical protein
MLVMQPRDLEFVPILIDVEVERVKAVDLLILDAAGEIVPRPAFDADLLLCFRLSDELKRMQTEDAEAVAVQRFDDQELVWLALPTGPGWTHDQICATINHLSIFALAVRHPSDPASPEPALKIGPTATPVFLELYGVPQELP